MHPALILAILGAGLYVLNKANPEVLDFDYQAIVDIPRDSSGEFNYPPTKEEIKIAIQNSKWLYPGRAAVYIDRIRAAEIEQGIPEKLLGRLLYQESRFRADVIYGPPNRAGAQGIAQIIKKWHPSANPGDPWSSIDYAAKYLRECYNRFGDWKLALAAYNWGPSVLAAKGIGRAPLETRNYVYQISRDVLV